jgi:hypothetical protein
MSFLHLWALGIGAVALGAPVVIHWLTRPRPKRMPLSTLRFVREAIQQRRSRNVLRDLIVLGLRMAAVALLALALARPLWGPQPLISDRQSGDAVRVVLLDVSQSMQATVGAVQQIEQAKTLAANRYLNYRPGLRANLILAGAVPRSVFEGPSTNFEVLREELARCRALPERLDAKAALERAGLMLTPAGDNDRRRRELVILSDFQRTSWAKADFSAVPAGVQIQLESTAPAEAPPNLAVLRAAAHGQSSRPESVEIELELGNFTPSARKMAVDVTLGSFQRRLEAVCPPGGRTTLVEEAEIHGSGWLTGEVRLAGIDDALAADNVRPLVVQLHRRPTYALITRQPPDRRPSSSHFLECALVPDGHVKEHASAAVLRLDPSTLDAKSLAPADLVCLDHPGKLSEEAVKLLAGVLRHGRPLLYVAGEWIDAANLKLLAESSGSGLRLPVEFVPPQAGAARRMLFLKSVRGEVQPFSIFGDGLAATIGRLRLAGGLGSRQLDSGLADDVLATYNDGSACLVCTSSDAGTLAVLNVDLAASNLPGSPAFVPMLEELVERMLHRNGGVRPACCGEYLVAQLPADVTSPAGLRIVGPDGTSEASGGRFGELVEEGAAVAWRWRSAGRPGAYRICRDNETLFAQAVEVPAEESQLESLSPRVLKERLASGYRVYFSSAAAEEDRRDDLWNWLAVACVVCLLGEMVSLVAFRT